MGFKRNKYAINLTISVIWKSIGKGMNQMSDERTESQQKQNKDNK